MSKFIILYWVVRTFHDRKVKGGMSSELANTKSQKYHEELNCGHVCHLPSSVSELCPQARPSHWYSASPDSSSHIWMKRRKDPALHKGLYLTSFNLSVRKAFSKAPSRFTLVFHLPSLNKKNGTTKIGLDRYFS